MPRIVDYPTVLDLLTRQGLKSLYYNSGAFGFPPDVQTTTRGWIGKPDAAIRPAAMQWIRQVNEPFGQQLSAHFLWVWKQYLPGPVWVMPKSHWAYELEFGSRAWMPAALAAVGVDWQQLLPLNNAAAIEFAEADAELLGNFVIELLTRLDGSDFQAVFAGGQTICTIHSRGQLWWTTVDAAVAGRLDAVLGTG